VKKQMENNLLELFEQWSGGHADDIIAMPQSGSYREYYRIFGSDKTAIGVYNADKKENNAFITFSRHFLSKRLNVPVIYAENLDQNVYLQEDLGDISLFSLLSAVRQGKDFPPELFHMYRQIVEDLPSFQIEGGKGLDYSVCYPRESFDKQSMMWDLNYFKYYFLKLAKIPFDEQGLEEDFQKFSDFLLQADRDYFLYRDFQSRNIMIRERKPYYIDYQGGRKGALQYDLASLLYDSKADLPHMVREKLLQHYISTLKKRIHVDEDAFLRFYQGYSLIRIMQAMGAYGFRGFYEKKAHFLQSIPYALNNLRSILDDLSLPVRLPELVTALNRLVDAPHLKKFKDQKRMKSYLKVTINSFSYKSGIPADTSGNGGGFVFDCRAIHNPGRYEEYKSVTGMDKEVIEFFKNESDIDHFIDSVYYLVDQSVDKYLQRNFNNLMVNFGCTGGQHRSVYCAEKLAERLKEKYDVEIEVNHTELAKKNIVRQ
jgi:aminoglycoside/choline kinase family phosphotransferase